MAKPKPAGTKEEGTHTPPNDTVDAMSNQLLLELSKALLSGSLSTVRGAMQLLQGITGILLGSYTAILVGFGKQVGVGRLPLVLVALPIVFTFCHSFAGSFK